MNASDQLGPAWTAGDPHKVAAILANLEGDIRGALEACEGGQGSSFWLLMMADQHRAAMLLDLYSGDLDQTHFADFTHQLSALLLGAVHVPGAMDQSCTCVRAAEPRIAELTEALGGAQEPANAAATQAALFIESR